MTIEGVSLDIVCGSELILSEPGLNRFQGFFGY